LAATLAPDPEKKKLLLGSSFNYQLVDRVNKAFVTESVNFELAKHSDSSSI